MNNSHEPGHQILTLPKSLNWLSQRLKSRSHDRIEEFSYNYTAEISYCTTWGLVCVGVDGIQLTNQNVCSLSL